MEPGNMRGRGLTLLEIVVLLVILSVLGFPFVQGLVSMKRQVEGVPKRLCALYFAHDLMEERLDKRFYSQVQSIRKLRLDEFSWTRDNFADALRATGGGTAGAGAAERIRNSKEFLHQFSSQVTVTEEVPGKRKRVLVTVSWMELGRTESVVLESTLES